MKQLFSRENIDLCYSSVARVFVLPLVYHTVYNDGHDSREEL